MKQIKHPAELQKIIDQIAKEREGKNWNTTDRMISEAIINYYKEVK